MTRVEGFSELIYRRCQWTAALVAAALLLFGCGSSNQNDTGRGVRYPSQKPDLTSSEIGVGDLYSVVVGVSRYSHPKIPSLKFADKDAKDFADFLRTQTQLFKDSHLTLLLNEQASQKEVKKWLYYGMQRAGKDDTVVLFFAGHGADDPNMPGEFFFLTNDADPDFLEATSVNMSQGGYLKRIDSKRVLVIADTCFAGGFSKAGARGGNVALEKLINDFKHSEGKIFLTSSMPNEISREDPSLRNGIFTHYLLEGLKGNAVRQQDGVITLKDAYDYAYEKTLRVSRGGQHPQWAGVVQGRFPISFASLRVGPPTRSPADMSNTRTEPSHSQAASRSFTYVWLSVGSVSLLACLGFVVVTRLRRQRAEKETDRGEPPVQPTPPNQVSPPHDEIAAKLGEMEKLLGQLVSENQAIAHDAMTAAARREETESFAAKLQEMEQKMVALLREKAARAERSEAASSEQQAESAARFSELEKRVEELIGEKGKSRKTSIDGSAAERQSEFPQGNEPLVPEDGCTDDALQSSNGAAVIASVDNCGSLGASEDQIPGSVARTTSVADQMGINVQPLKQQTPLPKESQVRRQRILGVLGGVFVALALLFIGLAPRGFLYRDPSKDAALIEATRKGLRTDVERLLSQGADPNARDTAGWSALMCAAYAGSTETVQVLLDHGADINAKSKGGFRVIQFAKSHPSVVKLLLARGADMGTREKALMNAAEAGKKEVVERLLTEGADVNAVQDETGQTALQKAARMGYTETVRLLLDRGAQINARNGEGGTALAYAAQRGHAATIQLLLDRGADPNLLAMATYTALDHATFMRQTAAVRLLQEHGGRHRQEVLGLGK